MIIKIKAKHLRFGYINPINYNDNEVFCGGVSHQFEKNNGRCWRVRLDLV